uniref:Protein-serine/threonine kinase n=1 Tax=Erythrolobus australicus TaxID=1077150 RepID=A0A7S1XJB6_9RHOD
MDAVMRTPAARRYATEALRFANAARGSNSESWRKRRPLQQLPGFCGGLSSAELAEALPVYARAPQTPTSLRTLFEFGLHPTPQRVMLSAQFLHQELAVRLAHRAHELASLPLGLNKMPSVRKVHRMYESSFAALLRQRRPRDTDTESALSDTMTTILHRHEDVVKLVARGVLELKAVQHVNTNNEDIQRFLDRFYSSRIGMRMLIAQHLAIRESSARENYVGIINSKCAPEEVILDAAEAVRSLAYRHYGDAPEVEITGALGLRFPYVDSYLFFPMFELLKNSVRATVEAHENADSFPNVRVAIAGGEEDVTIKISDEGGGIKRSAMPSIWTYLFTTAEVSPHDLLHVSDSELGDSSDSDENGFDDVDVAGSSPGAGYRMGMDPIAGFGYGLPLSRLYARYFGGDLTLVSMEGYGTDAYLHVCKLGDKQEILY